MNTNALRLALYARVSTEAQEDEGQSLSTQMDMMRAAAKRMGASIAAEYQVQESAMPGSDRPSVARLLEDASSGQFDAVMVCKLDRLARSIDVLRHIEGRLSAIGILLYEGLEEQNLLSAEGKLNRGVLALIGEYSVNRLKWSAAASRLDRARRGWPHSRHTPFGRRLAKDEGRRSGQAVWELDATEYALAQEIYDMYIKSGMAIHQIAFKKGLGAELVRRILRECGGPIWIRHFVDPATGQKVEVRTDMPPLFSPQQIKEIEERAESNRIMRPTWTDRKRHYALSNYIRCGNPTCGCANLSGATTRYYVRHGDKTEVQQVRSYYAHPKSKQVDAGCIKTLPAAEIETEILARLGELLTDSKSLRKAIEDAMHVNKKRDSSLSDQLQVLKTQEAKLRRTLANAVDLLCELDGSAGEETLRTKIAKTNAQLADNLVKQRGIEEELAAAPELGGMNTQIAAIMKTVSGLGGLAPIHWPYGAKRALLGLFFGTTTTRTKRSLETTTRARRGIFVTREHDHQGRPYWRYEARGLLGDFAGALTSILALYDAERREGRLERHPSQRECADLALLAANSGGLLRFRSTSPTVMP